MPFLQAVAQDIIKKKDNWGRFALIFPNARTINYFKRHYARLIDKPEKLYIFPWQKFLASAIRLRPAGNIELLFTLFQAFREVMGSRPAFSSMTFEQFFHIGQTILSDFNEVDNYLIDPEKIFVNLADLERLSDKDFLTQDQQEAIKQFWSHYKGKEDLEFFLELFSNMDKIYHNFRQRLLKIGRVYNGLRNRLIVEQLKNGNDLFSSWDTLAFIGFYALSDSELWIMNFLKQNHGAHFYWDYDNYYYQDTAHEAGMFLRKNIALLGQEDIGDHDNLLQDKNIEVVSVPRSVAQAKILDWAFDHLGIKNNIEKLKNTAVILLDESLLFPVLYSLPETSDEQQHNNLKINITLQFPFYLTSLYSFLDKWLLILSQLQRNKQVFYNDFHILLTSEVLQKFFPDFIHDFENKFKTTPQLAITTDFLHGLTDADLLFELESKNGILLIDKTLQLVHRIFKHADDFEREYIFHIHNDLQSLKKQLLDLGAQLDIDVLIPVLKHNFFSIRVPFEGQSLDALQVATIMETRNLDFENVIMLSVNEGIYPPIKRGQSFFPEFIRAAYHLPILRYQDSLYSYFFYRLIQRSKNVMLVYSSVIDQKAQGKSRYILQLEKETDLIKAKHVFTEVLTLKTEQPDKPLDSIPERRKKISPSAINTYIACPRLYFYRYIAGLKEPEDTNLLEMQSTQFGTIVHRTLELIYSDLSNKTGNNITDQALKEASQHINDFLVKAWEESDIQFAYDKGFFKVMGKAMEAYVARVLDFDRQHAPFSIVSLERSQGQYNTFIDIGDNTTVEIYGIIDRIDRKDDLIRLIDYKTGKDEPKVSNMDKLFEDDSNKAVFQLLLYRLMVQDQFSDMRIIPALYKLSKLGNKGYSTYITINKVEYNPEKSSLLDNEIMPEFQQRLVQLLRKIFLEDKTFPKTQNLKTCSYCPFKTLCGK